MSDNTVPEITFDQRSAAVHLDRSKHGEVRHLYINAVEISVLDMVVLEDNTTQIILYSKALPKPVTLYFKGEKQAKEFVDAVYEVVAEA